MDYVIVGILAIIGFLVVWFLVLMALAGGRMDRIILTKKAGLRFLRDEEFADKVSELMAPPAPGQARLDATPLRILTLLQREGRLLDFLMEDITGAGDEQIGAGVREIHQKCQKALKQHVELQPVFSQSEGDSVEVTAGFDPSAIQLTGNVTGEPPFKGTLVHSGWRVTDIKIEKPAEGIDELVIQPAEVELP